MKNIFFLIRPHQWLKNILIFMPLFFGKHLLEWEFLYPTIITFISYSFLASSIYCFNDIRDVEADRKHPKKCKRPIASGQVSVSQGYLLMLLCILLSIITLYFNYNCSLCLILAGYFLLNIAYCTFLKHIVLVDVFIIAFGFVLRILAGGVTTGIHLSHWIVLVTFLLALFLAFAKRRDDIVHYIETGVRLRKKTNRYTLEFLNLIISIIASITIVCYLMYTVSEEVIARLDTSYLYLTSIWVLAGIIRYLQLTIVDAKSGSPTKILMKDLFIQCCILGWGISFLIIIYYNKI